MSQLQAALLSSPVLMHPDQSKPFFVVTDASDFAVGASLEQEDDDGNRHPVAFLSHSLSSAERKYPTHERELLAIVIALRSWRHYLEGSDFKVICSTDHRPLQHFMANDQERGRQIRWQQFLTSFDLQITYIPGKSNGFADGLSRRPDLRLMLVAASADLDPVLRRILAAQKQDRTARVHFAAARAPGASSCWCVVNGVLYHSDERQQLRVFVPLTGGLRPDLLRQFHDVTIAGHFGWRKVCLALSRFYFWPELKEDVQRYVRACPQCQRIKATVQPATPILPLQVPNRPFEEISLDWVSGLPRNSHGHDSVLNIVDRFSKWAIVIPCSKTMSTPQFISALWEHVFSWVGLPAKIIGDRDTRLTASQMRALCRALQIKMGLSVPYHPQTDGSTERFNRTLLTLLRGAVNPYHSDWEAQVPAVLYAYRNTVHSATGFTPHYLLFGWEPTDLRVPLSAFPHPSSHPDIGAFLGRRAEEFKLAQRNIEHARQAMISARKASANAHTYAENDLVKVSTRVLRPKPVSTQVPKLQPSWVGPFKVLESIGPNAYRLQLPHEYRLVHDVFNAVDLRPWLQHEAHALEPGYPQPAVFPHPSLNPIVQVLDRSRLPGRVRTVDDPLAGTSSSAGLVTLSGCAHPRQSSRSQLSLRLCATSSCGSRARAVFPATLSRTTHATLWTTTMSRRTSSLFCCTGVFTPGACALLLSSSIMGFFKLLSAAHVCALNRGGGVLGSEAYTPVVTMATSALRCLNCLTWNVLNRNSDIKPCALFLSLEFTCVTSSSLKSQSSLSCQTFHWFRIGFRSSPPGGPVTRHS
jgi:RNase H-like domain found in reverse transcriptase/Integrase zinc binding domain/Integrase core domain